MGIPGLRNEIEACEKVVRLADLAEEHYHRTGGRTFKVAVDEAFWAFNSVGASKIAAIRRETGRQSNPAEKTIFHNICFLLSINIELIVVFDGEKAPPKADRKPRYVTGPGRELLKNILRALGIHYMDALREAEAECCQLQKLGRVDAVWSDDSDCLMFGCQMWLRTQRVAKEVGNKSQSKADTSKVKEEVRVVLAEDIQRKYGLTRERYVLYAMLAGADYDRKGLPECGHQKALAAAQSESSLSNSLCEANSQQDCDTWRKDKLLPYFEAEGVRITVPESYPQSAWSTGRSTVGVRSLLRLT